MSSSKLQNIAKKFIDNNFHLCVAESCTGGLLAKKITDESGSSAWFDCGLITYSNESKIRLLGVKKESLTECGAVSQEVAQEMAIGAQKNSSAVFSISITGIAGPNGGSTEKPVGTVFICFAFKQRVLKDYKLELSGNRSSIREQTVNFIIDELDKLTFNGQI
ncbi:MAG: CinA family protein [Methylophilaceae bacterium]